MAPRLRARSNRFSKSITLLAESVNPNFSAAGTFFRLAKSSIGRAWRGLEESRIGGNLQPAAAVTSAPPGLQGLQTFFPKRIARDAFGRRQTGSRTPRITAACGAAARSHGKHRKTARNFRPPLPVGAELARVWRQSAFSARVLHWRADANARECCRGRSPSLRFRRRWKSAQVARG